MSTLGVLALIGLAAAFRLPRDPMPLRPELKPEQPGAATVATR
jgi:hypothetical protein